MPIRDRLLFLDLDGTIVPLGHRHPSPAAVAAVKAMLADGRTRVVMISAQRGQPGGHQHAEAVMAAAGIPVAGWVSADIPSKPAAIAEWLYEHYGDPRDWPDVVIADDQADAGWLGGAATVVVPRGTVGLTGEEMRRV